jgi:hypothetical protein
MFSECSRNCREYMNEKSNRNLRARGMSFPQEQVDEIISETWNGGNVRQMLQREKRSIQLDKKCN